MLTSFAGEGEATARRAWRTSSRVASRAVRAATFSNGQVLVEDHPDPVPGVGQVLVRVRAAGLNGADVQQLKGRYPAPPGWPVDIPGLELAGEVAALGPGAQRFGTGERVMAVVGGGGQAEYACLHERELMPVPDALDWPAAGGAPEVFATAHDALFTQAGLGPSERLLVHGAAGGVGTAAVQLGRLAGARVTATVRREELRAGVAELGAEVIAPDGFAERGPFDVILELVGAPNLDGDLTALAPRGRLCVIGVGAGARAEIDLLRLMQGRVRMFGSTMRSRPLEEKAEMCRRLERHVLPAFESGTLRVPVAASYPLERADEAYERFQAGSKFGKVVLLMD